MKTPLKEQFSCSDFTGGQEKVFIFKEDSRIYTNFKDTCFAITLANNHVICKAG